MSLRPPLWHRSMNVLTANLNSTMSSSPQATPPESLIRDDTPLLRLKLECQRCKKTFSDSFEWACLDVEMATDATDADGLLLSKIVTCPRCGAEDEYRVAPLSMMRIMGMAMSSATEGYSNRIILGSSELWDGTPVHRPTQALAHLRALTESDPTSAEAFRRLGNGCKRWNRMDDALAAWRKACDLDEAEVDSAYGLALYLIGTAEKPIEGFLYLRRAVSALPAANRANSVDPHVTAAVIGLLERVARSADEPMALMAAWSSGTRRGDPVIDVGHVDLQKVESFERLTDLICADHFLEIAVTPELPDSEPTRLQNLLRARPYHDAIPPGRDILWSDSPQRPVRAAPSVGRNEPCPCGSGKKYKRCCGARSAPR